MKPLKRTSFDKAVTGMFRAADTNRDGTVTLDELRAVVAARRETIIRARFERIDADHDGSLSLSEFVAWQQHMGSAASSEDQRIIDRGGPVSETIEPDLGDKPGDRMLGMLIEPLSALAIVNANANYDAGVSLEELLAYEGKRFDAADTDGDGELSMDELRGPPGRPGDRGPGGPPDRRGPNPPGGPPGNGVPSCPPPEQES